jgi:hypothetical protein
MPNLVPEEFAALIAKHENPRDFAALILPIAQLGLSFADVQTPNGMVRVVVFQVMAIVPPPIMPPDVSNLIDPKTNQPQLSRRLRNALVQDVPAMFRVVVRRSALTDEAQAACAAIEQSGAHGQA